MEEKIVPYDSDEAAHRLEAVPANRDPDQIPSAKTTLWASRDSNSFWPDTPDGEHMARYCGCTHNRCGCGKLVEKSKISCDECLRKSRDEAFAKLPRARWDGDAWLYSRRHDKYLGSPETVIEEMTRQECSFDDLEPLICEPCTASALSTDDFADDLADGGDVPDELADAIKTFNEAMEGIVLSWRPTDVVATWPGAADVLRERLSAR